MAENTKTEIMHQETVMLGKEHMLFLEATMQRLQKEAHYRTTKSQLIRLFIEVAMKRNYQFKPIESEEELRQLLCPEIQGDKTRIAKK